MSSLAHTCAVLSRLAYSDDLTLGLIGQTWIARFDRGGTQAFISTDTGGRLYLAFRGTEEPADIKADLKYAKVDYPGGGRVHAGFLEAFGRIHGDVLEVLDEHRDRTWIFTGHSLGAALALLAAARWKPSAAYLYGCPRVGNLAFVATVSCSVYRFENRGDIVTKLPPPTSPMQIWRSLRQGRRPSLYRHAGKRVRLSGFGLGHRVAYYEAATAEM